MLATSTAATSGGGRGTGIQHSLNLQATNLGEGEELKSRYRLHARRSAFTVTADRMDDQDAADIVGATSHI